MKKISINKFKNFAIIQTAFIGDVVLTFPLVQFIKQLNPEAKTTLITTPVSVELAEVVEAIDEVIAFDKRGAFKGINGLLRFAKLLSEKGFDCIIAPHRSLRTTVLTYLTSKQLSIGFNTSALSFLYKKVVKYKFHYHEIERNCFLLSPFLEFNVGSQSPLPRLKKSFWENDKTREILLESGVDGSFVVVAPGSVWGTKMWLKEYYVELVKLLEKDGRVVVLIGSGQDYELCEFIRRQTKAVNLAGKTTLVQVLYVLSKSDLLVTNDSSPTHLAGLVNCPTIVIWGPTSPIFGFGPRGVQDISIELENLRCRPCHIHGKQVCPLKTHQCMRDILPEMVYEKCISILNNIRMS